MAIGFLTGTRNLRCHSELLLFKTIGTARLPFVLSKAKRYHIEWSGEKENPTETEKG